MDLVHLKAQIFEIDEVGKLSAVGTPPYDIGHLVVDVLAEHPVDNASALGAVTTTRDAQGMKTNGAPRSRSQRSAGAATTGSADTKEAWTAARPSQGCSPCDSR